MVSTLLLVAGSLVTADQNPRVARNLAANPVVLTVWQSIDTNNVASVQYEVFPLSSVPTGTPSGDGRTPVGTVVPQETQVINGNTFSASGPMAPDGDVDDAGNVAIAWVATPPYDPSTTPIPNPEVYLSYGGASPIRVSTDDPIPYPDPTSTTTLSCQWGYCARVAITRDGQRIVVSWAKGDPSQANNMGRGVVNATSIWARTYTVTNPGPAAVLTADGLPFPVSPVDTNYSGAGDLNDATGPYYFGDVACEKVDGASSNGYFVVAYVRDQSYSTIDNFYYNAGIYFAGYNWDGSGRFPELPSLVFDMGGNQHYTLYPTVDCYHDGATGYAGFVFAYNIGNDGITSERYDASGTLLASTSADNNFGYTGGTDGTGGYAVGARGAAAGEYTVSFNDHGPPDAYAVDIIHDHIIGDGPNPNMGYDVISPGYPQTIWYKDAQGVLRNDGMTVMTFEVERGPFLVQAAYGP